MGTVIRRVLTSLNEFEKGPRKTGLAATYIRLPVTKRQNRSPNTIGSDIASLELTDVALSSNRGGVDLAPVFTKLPRRHYEIEICAIRRDGEPICPGIPDAEFVHEVEWRGEHVPTKQDLLRPGVYRISLVTRDPFGANAKLNYFRPSDAFAVILVSPPQQAERVLASFAEVKSALDEWLPNSKFSAAVLIEYLLGLEGSR